MYTAAHLSQLLAEAQLLLQIKLYSLRINNQLIASDQLSPASHLSQLLAEAQLSHHQACSASDLLEVTRGAGGDVILTEDQLLSNTTTQSNSHLQAAAAAAAR
jgi:hypothetical protein